jgi:hypothetical protein
LDLQKRLGSCKILLKMQDDQELVPLRLLARELRIDRSHFRRYVTRFGIHPQKRQTKDSGNKLVVTVTAQEADIVRQARREQGYRVDGRETDLMVGVFYVIQLVPELDHHRIKLGFAEDVRTRLEQHRTAAPTAMVLKTWPCKRSWEFTVIDALSSSNCRLILNEVYECSDATILLARADDFFALLPDPSRRPELSDVSPHRQAARIDNEKPSHC